MTANRTGYEGRRIYFDTNAWLDLAQEREGVTKREVDRLRAATRSGTLCVLCSGIVVEEFLPEIKRNPVGFRSDMSFVLDTATRNRLVREPSDIIKDEVQHCLSGTGPVEYATEDVAIWWEFHRLARFSFDDGLDMLTVVYEAKRQAERFLWNMLEMQEHFLKQYAEQMQGHEPPPLAEAWSIIANKYVNDIAHRAGHTAFEDADASALLEMRGIRLGVGWLTVRTYEHFFAGTKPQIGDSRDMLHAISAAAADVFVSRDSTLVRTLRAIPKLPVEVVTLPAFLAGLCRRPNGSP